MIQNCIWILKKKRTIKLKNIETDNIFEGEYKNGKIWNGIVN